MTIDDIISQILKNRGIDSTLKVEEFFHPKHPKDIPSPFDSQPAIDLINSHIQKNSPIAIYGDYDVDGICSTAILWETLHANYERVFPHIPHRRTEGYGLSKAGVDHCLSQGAKLIIAVDNGIVAHEVVDYARSQDCDVIIIDHHEKKETDPNANVILHSTSSCAAGLTWFFCRDFIHSLPSTESGEGKGVRLELVALATICDQVPLIGTNRSFAKYGLEDLNRTTRPGLLALFSEASILPSTESGEGSGVRFNLSTYHVGFIIGPRLNASGRLEHAIDSLRLLCTTNPVRAAELAKTLGDTNRSRQELTEEAVSHALSHLAIQPSNNLLVASSDTYDEGIIGLIAAKLSEKFHRPAVAIAVGPEISKGSARSIPGFNITDHLRQFSDLLLGVGGHAAAAGFSLPTQNLPAFTESVNHPEIPPELLVKVQKYDLEIDLGFVNWDLWLALKEFEPFGLGNPRPVFYTKNVEVRNPKKIGKLSNHLKFQVGSLDAIYFNYISPSTESERSEVGGEVDLVYSIDENVWNGEKKLQLLIKELKSFNGSATR
ncbi:MAG: single-stranded-DNA-specific exonuclease RecJ [Patescibacteria group bacterium]